jgi:hypothetical protein
MLEIAHNYIHIAIHLKISKYPTWYLIIPKMCPINGSFERAIGGSCGSRETSDLRQRRNNPLRIPITMAIMPGSRAMIAWALWVTEGIIEAREVQ